MIDEIVKKYSLEIKNNRNIRSILNHLKGEVKELDVEVEYVNDENEDGIVGESIDIIACALDMIFIHKPDITISEIDEIMIRKCEKWKKNYSETVYKD